MPDRSWVFLRSRAQTALLQRSGLTRAQVTSTRYQMRVTRAGFFGRSSGSIRTARDRNTASSCTLLRMERLFRRCFLCSPVALPSFGSSYDAASPGGRITVTERGLFPTTVECDRASPSRLTGYTESSNLRVRFPGLCRELRETLRVFREVKCIRVPNGQKQLGKGWSKNLAIFRSK
jgi:hypothetical protein